MSSGSEKGYPSRKIVSTRVYESGPLIPAQQEVVSTTQTEEWTTKKKTDKLVTKQIKTRVKREIVVTEDGEILEDSGPFVTTDTTEETKTDEQEDVEHKTSGGGDPGPGWTLVPGSKVVHETKKSNTSSHETKEEKNESEITEEIGGLTREEIARALKHRDLAAIKVRRDSSSTTDSKPRLQSRSHKRVDTEEVDEVSEFKDGHLSTETRKKSNREEHFGDHPSSSEDEKEPVVERVEKKSWPLLGADERRTSSSPTVSSGRSSSKNVKINSRGEVVVVDGEGSRHSSRDYGSTREKEKDKVRATSPSSFNSSHLQQVDRRTNTPSSLTRARQVWTEEDKVKSRNRINSTKERNSIEEEDGTENRSKTFKWVENHFGSQDFEDSGILTEASSSPSLQKEYYIPITSEIDGSTYRRIHHSKRQQMPTEKKVKYRAPEPPIPPLSSSKYIEKDSSSRPSSRSTNKTDSQWTSTSSTPGSSIPKNQYFLGEDPVYGKRFTGMIDMCTGKSIDDVHHNSDSAYSTLSLSRPHHCTNKPSLISQQRSTTLDRPPDLRFKTNDFLPKTILTNGNAKNHLTNGQKLNGSTLNIHRSSNVDLNSPPSVTDIIHSLRSKEFLEKENSAVSIRDDDSVYDIRSVSQYRHRPTTLLKKPQLVESFPVYTSATLTKNKPLPSKPHVIKITINSDGSECSSPVNSPALVKNGAKSHHLSQQFDFRPEKPPRIVESKERRHSHSTNTVGGDSIVKNAISNLMKTRMTNGPSNGESYNSLSRTSSPRNGTNLTKSKVYLSSPNVSKLAPNEPEIIKMEPKYYKPTPKYSYTNNRSQSINNLNFNNNDDWSPQKPYSTNSTSSNGGITRLNVNDFDTNDCRNRKKQANNFSKSRVIYDSKNGHHYQSNDFSENHSRNYRNFNNVSYSIPARDYSPPSSPINNNYKNGHNHVKLPSPIPPTHSRSSSSPPSSPLPNLTRPFSPNYSRDYDSRNDYYNSKPRVRSTFSKTPSFNSRSPSPPTTFVRRPPSPVLPAKSKRASSIGDDAASSISGLSQSTNCTGSVGSKNSSETSNGEKIITTSKRKTTTTTTKKREVEQPDDDYYYEKAITGSLNRKETNRVNGHNNKKNLNSKGNGIRFQSDYISSR